MTLQLTLWGSETPTIDATLENRQRWQEMYQKALFWGAEGRPCDLPATREPVIERNLLQKESKREADEKKEEAQGVKERN
jgi:hypothetical protein